MLMVVHCKRHSIQSDTIVNKLLHSLDEPVQDIFLSLLNMGELKGSELKLPKLADPIGFVKREKYAEEIVERVLEVALELIKEVLGEREEEESESSKSMLRGSSILV